MSRQDSAVADGTATAEWEGKLAEPYDRLLKKIDGVDKSGEWTLSDALDEQTGIGGGEAGTAGAHQDRELVELLQNGRDAIQQSDDECGSLYVEVRERGVLVANTGSPFNIRDDNIREDLRKITFSRKDEGAIGEKGVGLTSVCMVGEAYEVWTQPDVDGIDRFECGPVNPTAAVAARTTADAVSEQLDTFTSRLSSNVERLETWFDEAAPTIPVDDVRPEDVEALPFFYYPLPLRVPETPSDAQHPLQERAMELLQGTGPDITDADGNPIDFTTAVIVRFQDELLREFRDALNAPRTGEKPAAESIAADLWERLSYSATNAYDDLSGQVTPESLVHFENVEQVVLRNATEAVIDEQDSPLEETWTIEREERSVPSTADIDRDLRAADVAVTVNSADECDPIEHRYDQFERPLEAYPRFEDELETGKSGIVGADSAETSETDRSASEYAYARVLVPRDARGSPVGPMSHSYPPYLYYPIASAGEQFPFCVHGNFEVSKDRKELYSHSTAHNALVLREAAALLADVATVAAAAESTEHDHDLSLAMGYPWNVLPPLSADDDAPSDLAAVLDSPADADVLEYFCAAVYDRLREQPCVPSARTGGPMLLEESLLHADRAVVKGIVALHEVAAETIEGRYFEDGTDTYDAEETIPTPAVDKRLPTKRSAGAFLDWESHPELNTVAWSSRYERLLDSDTADGDWTETLLRDWVTWLRTLLESDPGLPSLDVEAETGRALFGGTAALVSAHSTATDRDVGDVLGDYVEPAGNGVYLLPCETADRDVEEQEDDAEMLSLVPIESHRREGDGADRTYTRTVFWRGDDAPETTLPTPGGTELRGAEFDVFVIDAGISESEPARTVLSAAGNRWGIVQLQSYPQYVRELLGATSQAGDRTGRATDATVSVEGVEFFASALEGDERGKLAFGEGAYLNDDDVEKHTKYADRSRRLRNRLAARRARLSSELLEGTDADEHVSAVRLDADWQRQRHRAAQLLDSDAGAEPEDGEELDAQPIVSSEPVESVPSLVSPDAATDRLAVDTRMDTEAALARLFGTFGVGVIPGLEILVQAETPDGGDAHWNPSAWTETTARQASLKEAVSEMEEETAVGARDGVKHHGGYLDFVTAPEHGPNATAGHSSNCDVKDIRGRYTQEAVCDETIGKAFDELTISLESWVWRQGADESGRRGWFTDLGSEYVSAVLETYGGKLVETVLTTGWSCREDHGGRHGWTDRLPTLLNWQLRHSSIWTDSDVVTTPQEWETPGPLAWAVTSSGAGRRTNNWLPTVDITETDVDEDVWDFLGVTSLESLSPSAAAYRLQKMQEELASADLAAELGPVPLDEPQLSKQGSGWKTVYSALVDAINGYLAADSDRELSELPFLTHLPVKAGVETWLAAPIEAIRERDVYWYSDTQALPWEDRTGSREGPWVLETAIQGGSKHLAEALACDIRRSAATRPVMTLLEDGEGKSDQGQRSAPLADLTNEMRNRLHDLRPLLLAVLTAERPTNEIDEETDAALTTAIEALRAVPERRYDRYLDDAGLTASDDRFASGSTIYELPSADGYGLAYNAGLVDPGADVDDVLEQLTDGLRLLFERSRSTDLRLALRGEEALLESDVPLREMRRQLDERTSERLQAELDAVRDLVSTLGVDVEFEMSSRDRLDELDADPYRLATRLGTAFIHEDGDPDVPEEFQSLLEAVKELPRPYAELARAVVDDGSTAGRCPCQNCAELAFENDGTDGLEAFLEWAWDHHSEYEIHWGIRAQPRHRLDELVTVWRDTTPTEREERLGDVTGWQDALQTTAVDFAWTAPPRYRSIDAIVDELTESNEGCWFEVSSETVSELVEAVLSIVAPESPAVRKALRRYVDGTDRLPQQQFRGDETSMMELRADAWNLVTDTELTTRSLDNQSAETVVFHTRNGGSGQGGSIEISDRPAFAEEVVFAHVCQQYRDMLSEYDEDAPSEQNAIPEVLETILERICDPAGDLEWHTKGRCQRLQSAGTPRELATTMLEEIEADETSHTDSATRQALVAADERGPGYDVLDVTGRLAASLRSESDDETTPSALVPTPVEVKAVTGDGPHRVRFTVNELRRALEFAADADASYLLQLVCVEDDGDGGYRVELAGAESFDEPDDIYRKLESLDIDHWADLDTDPETLARGSAAMVQELVKGGYITLEL